MHRIFLFTSSLISVAVLFYILIVGEYLIIPFVIALVIWYLVNSIRQVFMRVKIGNRALPSWLTLLAATLSIIFVLTMIGELIAHNANAMMASAPTYKGKLESLTQQGMELVGIDELPNFANLFEGFDYTTMVSNIVNTLSGLAGNIFLILIYVGFFLAEQGSFNKKLTSLFPNEEQRDRIKKILSRINESIQTYLSVKTLASFLTGLLSFIILLSVGVDFAIFWASLIFLLNYIPTIGSLIATAFPALLALIQFDHLTPFVIVLIGVGAVQVAVGNILEPRLMGSSLNLSPLVVILSLSLWGAIWGVAGMILCVPIMVILMIILAQFPLTRPVAILLSANGKVA